MPDSPTQHPRSLGLAALAVIAPIWGYSWVVTKVALGFSGPLTFAALISGLGAVCLFGVLVAGRGGLRPPPLGWTLVIGLLQTALFNGLAIAALAVGGTGRVTVLVYTMPFWLLMLAWLLLGEHLRGLQWAAIGLAFVGLVLVVQPWSFDDSLSGILACGAGLSWAGGALSVKLLQRREPQDTLSLTAWQLLLGAIPLIAAAVVVEGDWPDWTSLFLACLAYAVLLANAVCWTLWIFALRTLPAGAAGLGTLAVPVIGILAAWLQLEEAPALVEGVGMALIVTGLAALATTGTVSGPHSDRAASDPSPSGGDLRRRTME